MFSSGSEVDGSVESRVGRVHRDADGDDRPTPRRRQPVFRHLPRDRPIVDRTAEVTIRARIATVNGDGRTDGRTSASNGSPWSGGPRRATRAGSAGSDRCSRRTKMTSNGRPPSSTALSRRTSSGMLPSSLRNDHCARARRALVLEAPCPASEGGVRADRESHWSVGPPCRGGFRGVKQRAERVARVGDDTIAA